MKPLSRLLVSSSFAALAGCASVQGEITDREDPDGYERISKQQDGNMTVFQLRNGCVVTETITQEPNLYRFHGVMTCPWDKKAEP
ncbi:MAG: hypothetical protein KDI90_03010 [Alphaproteobacteria bacterium]|nr:hypothetical protein [Alphaproteobacteria bacterium]MCB9974768.1 hypothetical protein [Rhodospirillales bacterium]